MIPVEFQRCTKKVELLEILINKYCQDIKGLCYSYILDWGISEDITQEVFISCYIKMDFFRGDSSYKTWIAKIAINKCKDFLRTRKNRLGNSVSLLNQELNHSDLSIENMLIKKEEHNILLKQILSLPEKYRLIIFLYYYEELKIWEIQKVTGLNQDTVKTRLRRAKHLIRVNIVGELNDR